VLGLFCAGAWSFLSVSGAGGEPLVSPAPVLTAPPEVKERFGLNVRRLREAAGLTQLELSMRSGVDAAEISRLERAAKEPMLGTIVRLADGLGVAAGELLRGVERPR
jgi:ribosome-binding protein aMBF1 (putative translation factor)